MTIAALIAYCSRKTAIDLDDPIAVSSKPPKEYLDLFVKQNRELLVPDEIEYFKNDYPVAGFYFKNKKYVVQVFKIGGINNVSLRTIVNINNYYSDIPDQLPYRLFSEHLFYTMFRPYKGVIKGINFNLNRDSMKLVASNDSVISVYSNIKLFSLQYNQTDTIRIFGKPGAFMPSNNDYNSSVLPISITFLKRNNFIYMLIMSINKAGEKLEPESLHRLIYGNV